MQHFLKQLFSILLLPALFIACTNEESELGLNLQDPASMPNTSICDTIKIDVSTFRQDSLVTSGATKQLLGIYKDNVFGQVNASIFAQISLANDKGLNLTNAQSLDSLILILTFSDYYPKNITQGESYHVQVFQLSEDLTTVDSKKYYSFDKAQYNSTPIFDKTIAFNATDSITINGEKSPPQLRLTLNPSFMQTLKSRVFTNNADFVEFIKGFYICVKPEGITNNGQISYFSLSETATSGMFLYYKGETASDTLYRFIFDKSGVRFCNFEHNYTGTLAPLNTVTDSIKGDNRVYLETMGGTYIKFSLPNLMQWQGENKYAINRATLYLTVSSDSPSDDNPPQSILCYMRKSDGSKIPVLDAYSGTSVVSVNLSNGQYKIPLTRHVQNMLNGTYGNWGLDIYVLNSSITANRVVVNGTKTDSNPMYLQLIYTK